MKFAIALVIVLASLASSERAFANSQDAVVTNIPFDFVIGNTTLSAGKYSISRISADNPHSPLLIRSTDGSTAAIFLPTTSESVTGNDNPELVFQQDGDTLFLRQVVAELSTYTFAKPRSKRSIAASGVTAPGFPSP